MDKRRIAGYGTMIGDHQVYELIPHFRPPVTSSDRIQIRANAAHLKNAGNIRVRINGVYTLDQGDVLEIGNFEELNITIADLVIEFSGESQDGNAANQRLEYIEYTVNHPKLAEYIEQFER